MVPPEDAATTVTVPLLVILMVMAFDVAVAGDAQAALEVRTAVITEPLVIDDEL